LMSAAESPPVRDFLLCPIPQIAVFDKAKANIEGAVYDAKNWSCRVRPS
jgi:feruloyl esterase